MNLARMKVAIFLVYFLMPRLCKKCREPPGGLKCSGCLNEWYCSKECQAQDWMYHKFDCNPKNGLTTADRLWRDCQLDVIPDHEQTIIDYGFQRAFSGRNQSTLLGVYQYVTIYSDTPASAKTLHRWRKRGMLLEEIIKSYDSAPLKFHGGDYTWLMENQWVLDGKKLEEWEGEKALADAVAQIYRKGWIYSGGSDTATESQIQEALKKWSDSKRICWLFCGCLLEQQFPGPETRSWISFGFCTCILGSGSEHSLCCVYQELIDLCTFDEFLLAYETSQLYALFRSKGLAHRLEQSHPLVEGVLKTSPMTNHSVWDLKQFVFQKSTAQASSTLKRPINSVNVDYGFMNCKTIDELNDLKAVYKTLFEDTSCSPPELHLACIEGQLFEYISKRVKLKGKKKYKRLTVNPHPLPNFDTVTNLLPISHRH